MLRKSTSVGLGDKFIHIFDVSSIFSHPMNTKIATNVCSAILVFIEFSKDIFHAIRSVESDEMRSSVGCLQVVSDKSQKSLSVGSLQFYAPNVRPLKFS